MDERRERAQNDYSRLTPAQSNFVHGAQSRRGSLVNMVKCGRMIQTGRVFAIRVRIPRVIISTAHPTPPDPVPDDDE